MRIHHLNCGTMRPVGGRLLGMRALGCHCLLIETERGLVLVDTGFGTADVEQPRPRLSGLLLRLTRPRFDTLDTAVEQVREFGFKPADVRHIVLTHLDFDHAGGITDFPRATIHVSADEAAAARRRRGFLARRRYRPAQWRAAATWQEYRSGGEPWFGFAAVHELAGLPPEILLVPLPGHTLGHCGVAVRDEGRWLLHAGDAYIAHEEMNAPPASYPSGLRRIQRFMQTDGEALRHTQERLRDLAQRASNDVTLVCSHDLRELESCQRAAERRQRRDRAPAPRQPGSAA